MRRTVVLRRDFSPGYWSGESDTKVQWNAAGRVSHSLAMGSHERRSATALLSVIDDDESLPDLLREFGFAARTYSSAAGFLSSDSIGQTECLILDVAMPGMTGLDLQHALERRGQRFRSSSSPVRKTKSSRSTRTNEELCNSYKPFSDTAVLDAIDVALRVK
jgi:DNA-binding NtrC family response regulator